MNKRTAVVDKCLLENICRLPDEQATHDINVLKRKYAVVVPLVLMEEVLAKYVETGSPEKKRIVKNMVKAIVSFYPSWMEHPLELVYKESVLGRNIASVNRGLSAVRTRRLQRILANILSGSPSRRYFTVSKLQKWYKNHRKEKEKRLERRLQQQKFYQQKFYRNRLPPSFFLQPDMKAFAAACVHLLKLKLAHPQCKQAILKGYLRSTLERWHSKQRRRIQAAFSRFSLASLAKRHFTGKYLLLELMYDLAPITRFGPKGELKFVSPPAEEKQMNNEEDQEYVASALLCDGLVTCDQAMHRIACGMREIGLWNGSSWYVPSGHVDRLEQYLPPVK